MSTPPKWGAASAARCWSRCSRAAQTLGYRQMVAVIGGRETVASIRLHEALGFAHMGMLPSRSGSNSAAGSTSS